MRKKILKKIRKEELKEDNIKEKIKKFIEEDTSTKQEELDNVDFSESDDTLEVIVIDEEDLIFDIKEEIIPKEEDIIDLDIKKEEDIVLSKHTIEGKHSLKYDSIFKGKKDDGDDNEDFDVMFFNEKFEVDKSSGYWFESIDNENYVKEKKVKEKVYEILCNHTDLNLLNNRRKPSKQDFNQYYYIIKTQLKNENFTNIELFNELSVYFSDNLFNMFKLLDNKWRNMIIDELQEHIGKKSYSNELLPRNLHIGTEIEFKSVLDDDSKKITGVIIEIDIDNLEYKINSYENIYNIKFNLITKILNNNKFKYNLNKLNNIDFF